MACAEPQHDRLESSKTPSLLLLTFEQTIDILALVRNDVRQEFQIHRKGCDTFINSHAQIISRPLRSGIFQS